MQDMLWNQRFEAEAFSVDIYMPEAKRPYSLYPTFSSLFPSTDS